MVVSNTADIPSRDIPIKRCLTEHVTHVSNTADIPSRDIPIKGGCFKEHDAISVTLLTFHLEISPLKGVLQNMHLMLGNTADIPLTNIIIKITLFLKAYSYW